MACSHARCGPWLLLQALMFPSSDAWSPKPPIYRIDKGDGKEHKSLYPHNGPVKVMIGEEDWKLIQADTNSVWLVEFYDTGCPHCWYFSGIYPRVAAAISSATVKVAAFNCVDPINAKPCSDVYSYPVLRTYNLKAPGDSKREVNVHKGADIDQDLTPEAIATKLSADSNGRITIVHPEVFRSQQSAGHVVDPRGPPGKDGWPDEAYGSVGTRFHDAHIGLCRLLMDGYTSAAKYEAALNVVQFIGTAYAKDEQKMFQQLLSDLQAQPHMEPVPFRTLMANWMKQFNQKYMFCKTKTCSVWQLFHTISALIAIRYAPIEVSEALPKFRYMVDNFLDCEVCRQHFVQAYDACLFGRCDILGNPDKEVQSKALVLWLWRTHSAVSQRVVIQNAPTDGGKAIDRRWPAFHDCVGCWKTTVVNGAPADLLTYHGQTNNDQPVYGVYNEDKVFGYILQTYLGESSSTRLFEGIPPVTAAAHSASMGFMSRYAQVFATISCACVGAVISFAAWRIRRSPRDMSTVLTEEDHFLEEAESIE